MLKDAVTARGLDVETGSIGKIIGELHLLANVARHGDGKSLLAPYKISPTLWPNLTERDLKISKDLSTMSEFIRVADTDIRLYARAALSFWERADDRPEKFPAI